MIYQSDGPSAWTNDIFPPRVGKTSIIIRDRHPVAASDSTTRVEIERCHASLLLGKVVGTVLASTCRHRIDLHVTILNQASRMAQVAPPSDPDTRAAMRLALAAGRIGIWHWDIATEAVLWDGALCVVYGLSPAEAPRTAPEFLGLVIPDDRDATVRTVSHGLEGAAAIEHRFHASVGGRTFWIYDRAHVIRDRDARPISVIGICCDVAPDPAASIVAFPGPLGDHRPVDLAAYLGTMIESLRRDPGSGETRVLHYDATPLQCTFDCAVKLGLILLELVAPVGAPSETSSGRQISVSLSVGARSGSLQIADDRTGHPAGSPNEIGIESATALAQQIGGTLVADTAAAAAKGFGAGHPGKSWRLDFPLPNTAA
jgi:PAS domain-containing protein